MGITEMTAHCEVHGFQYFEDGGCPHCQREAELRVQRAELLEACEEAEWGGLDVYGPMCPVCGGLMAEGHRANCNLKAAIDKAKGQDG